MDATWIFPTAQIQRLYNLDVNFCCANSLNAPLSEVGKVCDENVNIFPKPNNYDGKLPPSHIKPILMKCQQNKISLVIVALCMFLETHLDSMSLRLMAV